MSELSVISGETYESIQTKLRALRLVSVIEATSYLILLVATAVKWTGGSEAGVQLVGPIHGVLFLAYALLVIRDRKLLGWTPLKTVVALILGSLPFGGFWVERRWLATAGLES